MMKRYRFPNVWPEVTSIVNKRTSRSEGPIFSASCRPLPLSDPQGAAQLTLETTAVNPSLGRGVCSVLGQM
jgi:hypothetical protein